MKWNGLIKILSIRHVSENGRVLWEKRNLLNTFHAEGEQFVLETLFVNGNVTPSIPDNYYLGLDNRTSVSVNDDMDTIADYEVVGGGYVRNLLPCTDSTVGPVDGIYRATTPVFSFGASGVGFTARNLFLTDQPDNTGYLISSVPLSNVVTLTAGESMYVNMVLALQNKS